MHMFGIYFSGFLVFFCKLENWRIVFMGNCFFFFYRDIFIKSGENQNFSYFSLKKLLKISNYCKLEYFFFLKK